MIIFECCVVTKPSPKPTPAPKPSPSPAPITSPTPTPTPKPSPTSVPKPTPTPAPIASPSPSPIPTPIPVNSIKQIPVRGYFELRPGGGKDTLATLAASPSWQRADITGFAIRLQWMNLEPSSGNYDFSYIDAVAKMCASHNKLFSLDIVTGFYCPIWLKSITGPYFNISAQTKPGPAGSTHPGGAMPAPWDVIFQNEYSKFLYALGNKYDSNPYLAYVIVQGHGWGQGNLCESTGDNTELTTAGGALTWIKAFETIANFYYIAFPHTPCIANIGHVIYPSDITPFEQAIANIQSQSYGHLFGIKNNGFSLKTSTGWYGTDHIIATSSNPNGAQEVAPIKTVTDLQSEIKNLKTIGIPFLELYPSSIQLVPDLNKL